MECFQKALALKPDYDLAVFNMANVYRTIGRDDDALVGYRRLIELDPRNAQAHQEAGQVLVDHDKLDEAQKELNRALELQPAMAAARNTLGALRLKRGDPRGPASARFEPRSNRSPVSGSHISIWRWPPSSAAISPRPSPSTKRRSNCTRQASWLSSIWGRHTSGSETRTVSLRRTRHQSRPTPSSLRVIYSSRSCISTAVSSTRRSHWRAVVWSCGPTRNLLRSGIS